MELELNRDYHNPEVIENIKGMLVNMIHKIYPTFKELLIPELDYISWVSYKKALNYFNPKKGSFSTIVYFYCQDTIKTDFLNPYMRFNKVKERMLKETEEEQYYETDYSLELLDQEFRQVVKDSKLYTNKKRSRTVDIVLDRYLYDMSVEEVCQKYNVSKTIVNSAHGHIKRTIVRNKKIANDYKQSLKG